MTGELTKSEKLFEEICAAQELNYTRLPTLVDEQQPDYELDLGSDKIVVEVKEAEPSKADIAFEAELTASGRASRSRSVESIAARAKSHIDSASKQIKAYLIRNPNTPAIIALHDLGDNKYNDPYMILRAMFGSERVDFAVDKNDPSNPPRVSERGFFFRNDSLFRHNRKQYISAVATLNEGHDLRSHDRVISIQLFHNPFCSVPIDPESWRSELVTHFKLSDKESGHYQDWEKC